MIALRGSSHNENMTPSTGKRARERDFLLMFEGIVLNSIVSTKCLCADNAATLVMASILYWFKQIPQAMKRHLVPSKVRPRSAPSNVFCNSRVFCSNVHTSLFGFTQKIRTLEYQHDWSENEGILQSHTDLLMICRRSRGSNTSSSALIMSAGYTASVLIVASYVITISQ